MDAGHIRALVDNNDTAIKKLYLDHRDVFISFGKKYSLDTATLEDIYQEAFVAIRKHAISGKLEQVQSSFRTYLFGIGKFMIYDELKRRKKWAALPADEETPETIEYHRPQLSEEQLLLQKHFKKLGDACKKMLTLFYYRGLTIEEIAQQGGYENGNVVRSTKSRCLKKLKELIKSSN